MHDDEETAVEARRPLRTYPQEWGLPPGAQYSEERAAWVYTHVVEHRKMEPYRALQRHAVRYQHLARRAELLAKKSPPA